MEAGKGTQLLVVVLLLLGIGTAGTYLAQQYGLIATPGSSVGLGNQLGTNSGGCANGYTAPGGFTCANFPAQYYVFDPLAPAGTASGISSAQVSVYDPVTLASKDVPGTTASTGLVTGGYNFISGQSWGFKVVTTNYVTEWLPGFIPAVSSTGTGVTAINIPLPQVKTNTWSWTASGSGTSWSSTFSTYSYAASVTTQITMSFTITANNNNQGWYSSYDPFNKVQNLAIWEFSSPSSPKTSMEGSQYSYVLNNVNYYQYILPDGFTTINPSYSKGSSAITANFPTTSPDGRYTSTQPVSQTITVGGVKTVGSLSQQFAGTTTYGGSVTFTATFNKGSLAGGTSETWTMKLFLGGDVLNFNGGNGYTAQGVYAPTTPTQATLTGGNSPTVILKN